jgi:hypothetical protein
MTPIPDVVEKIDPCDSLLQRCCVLVFDRLPIIGFANESQCEFQQELRSLVQRGSSQKYAEVHLSVTQLVRQRLFGS